MQGWRVEGERPMSRLFQNPGEGWWQPRQVGVLEEQGCGQTLTSEDGVCTVSDGLSGGRQRCKDKLAID